MQRPESLVQSGESLGQNAESLFSGAEFVVQTSNAFSEMDGVFRNGDSRAREDSSAGHANALCGCPEDQVVDTPGSVAPRFQNTPEIAKIEIKCKLPLVAQREALEVRLGSFV